MGVLGNLALRIRTVAVLLVLIPVLPVRAQGTIPALLLLAKEKVQAGKMAAYDANESRIAETCVRMRCPHAYVALKSVSAPDEVWWLNEYVSAAEKSASDRAWQTHPAMKALQPLSARKDSLRSVLKTTLLRRIAEASPNAPWTLAGTHFLLVADAADVVGFSGSVFEAPDGHQVVIAAATDLADAQARASPFGQHVTILGVERRWSYPAPEWVTADSAFWRLPFARP
jgi:hypothetical protein